MQGLPRVTVRDGVRQVGTFWRALTLHMVSTTLASAWAL
jgi:hypothetical protein